MPTVKQKKAAKRIVENGGNVSRAMIEVGYSPLTAKTPQKLTESAGFKEIMDEYLSDLELAEKHKQFLYSDREDIGIKALDMGYKLKGSYAPEKSVNMNVAIDPESTSKVNEALTRFLHGHTTNPSE